MRATHVHGASGTPQTRDGGYPKRADLAATMRWALKTMLVPPAMHQPATAAIVGLAESCSLAHVAANVPMTCWSAALSQARALAAARACASVAQSSPYPAQNAFPSASRRITRTDRSPC